MNINRVRWLDFSMGVQSATSWLLRKPNELEDSRNVLFNEEIGSMVGRKGVTVVGDPFSTTNKPPLGGHVARFRSGNVRMVACLNDGSTNTIVRTQNSTTGAWTTIISDLPPNSDVHFIDYLNEVYISGYSKTTGEPFQPRNVNSSLNVSLTRNLLNCPYPYFFAEYAGLLYACNVLVGTTRFPDRAYKSSAPTSVVTFVQGAQSGTLTTLKLDSVRYLKVGMAIDIHGKNAGTKKHDITITAVDKVTNIITFASATINVADNDEVYLDGRFGELALMWNTDYPTADRADFLAIIPGSDSTNEITAVKKSNNRLFLFTENSGTRWDGQNLVVFNNAVGCISQRTLMNIDDDYLIWLDANGKIWSRNEAQGDQQYISRGIYNTILSYFPEATLLNSHATMFNNRYKIYLGLLNNQFVRVVYDFDTNTWSPESIAREPGIHINDYHNGIAKPFFYGKDGKLYVDEQGDSDDGVPILFQAETGKTNFGSEAEKSYYGIFIYSSGATGLRVMAKVNDGQYKTMGQIEKAAQFIKFPENGNKALGEGSTIAYKIVGSYKGRPPVIEGIVPYFTNREDIPQNG